MFGCGGSPRRGAKGRAVASVGAASGRFRAISRPRKAMGQAVAMRRGRVQGSGLAKTAPTGSICPRARTGRSLPADRTSGESSIQRCQWEQKAHSGSFAVRGRPRSGWGCSEKLRRETTRAAAPGQPAVQLHASTTRGSKPLKAAKPHPEARLCENEVWIGRNYSSFAPSSPSGAGASPLAVTATLISVAMS